MTVAKFFDARKVAQPTARPFAPERTRACRTDYENARTQLLAVVAEPMELTGNSTRDGQTWQARQGLFRAAKDQFEAVYRDVILDHPELLAEYCETCRIASERLAARVVRRAYYERPASDSASRAIHVVIGDVLLGTIEPNARSRFHAFAADGTELGEFADQSSASAAIRAAA
jgi:hypothetical protein